MTSPPLSSPLPKATPVALMAGAWPLCLPPIPAATGQKRTLPFGACDAHAHVFGGHDRYPLAPQRSYTPHVLTPAHFITHLDAFGLTRGILVTPSVYGTDNSALVDALAAYPQRLRGVAVIDETVSDAELDRLSAAGVRGARFYIQPPGKPLQYWSAAGFDAFQALAPQLKARGWHAQVWIAAADLPAYAPALLAPGIELVFDHMASLRPAPYTDDAALRCMMRMLADNQAWLKLSGGERLSATGAPFADLDSLVATFCRINPNKLLWGSDWPHVNFYDAAPDDTLLLDNVERWFGDQRLMRTVMCDNPARLYGFTRN